MNRPRRAVRIIAGVLWTFSLLAAVLIVVELALRSSAAASVYEEVRKYPPHPFLQALPVMAADHVNAQGFRGDNVEITKPPKTFRVFTIGGSTTLGVTNTYADSYPALLQAALRERHPGVNIEVLNAGCPWYTSAHALVSYTVAVRQYQPDLVIYFEAINDLVRSFSPPWLAQGEFKPDYSHYLGPYSRLLGPNASYIDRSTSWLTWNMFARWLGRSPDPFNIRDADNVARIAGSMRAVDNPPFRSLPSFRRFSDEIIHFVQADGHAIMTASQASLFRADLGPRTCAKLWFGPLLAAEHGAYPSLAAMIAGMDQFNAAAREIAQARKIPFIDFASAVPKTSPVFWRRCALEEGRQRDSGEGSGECDRCREAGRTRHRRVLVTRRSDSPIGSWSQAPWRGSSPQRRSMDPP
jgi:lysophospholipase L1-like esterase